MVWTIRRAVSVLGLGVLLSLGVPVSALPASWISTGSLNTTGYVGTAILLNNGKVLATTGSFGFQSELYDPATGAWTSLAVAGPPLDLSVAVLLKDGRVLAVGGIDFAGASVICRLFDPLTSTWGAAAPLNVPRNEHTVTLLDDGRVLAVGGRGAGSVELTSAEIYDPVANSWTLTGSMTTSRYRHTATLLPDGRVMVTGGLDVGVPVTQTEVFDPGGGSWATVGPLGTGRYDHTASLLANGLVLAVGGNLTATAELFDPGPGTWSATASLPAPRFQHSATLLPSGLLLVAGGQDGSRLKSTYAYDYTTGTWSPTAPAPGSVPDFTDERSSHAATMLPDGRVLIVGGTIGVSFVSTAELFDPDAPAWSSVPNMNVSRNENSATLLKDGRVLVAGGASEDSAEVFDPKALPVPTWTPTANVMSRNRWRHSATLLLDGRVLVAGSVANAVSARTADLYDPAGNTWTATPDMNGERSTHSATLLANGEVLVTGGQDNAAFILASAERYDPGSNTWSTTTPMAAARWRHAATLLPDGRVLVTGGYLGAALNTAEIYDPGLETWTPTAGTMAVPRYWHTSTLLPSGKVLLVGGGEFDVDPAATSAELFDPATGMFTATGTLNVPHESRFTATLLTNGRVLVVGGDANPQSAEVYDPVTGTWAVVPSTIGQRWAHAAELLPDGRVLVAGSFPIGPTAEVFDVGRGENPSWRPVLGAATDPVGEGTSLVATGTQFQGISEASSGFSYSQSATNYPLVQLRRLDNEHVRWLDVDPALGWTDMVFVSEPLFGLIPGPALVTVFTNGMPSDGRVVTVDCSAPVITTEPVAVNGCVGAPSSFTVGTSALAPAFEWRKGGVPLVDGGSISGASTDTLTINPTALADAGSYDVVVSTCSATTSVAVPLTVFDTLSSVAIGVSGSTNMCTTCPGGTATETHSDGGPFTIEWGYRLSSGGSITPIPGATGTSYDLHGSDFPGVGNYFLVARTTALCGAVQISNEVPVTISATVPGDDVQYFTVTSRSTENVLEWVNPPSYDTVRVRFTQGSSCVAPTDPLAGGTFLADQTDLDGPGDRDRLVHGGRTNGTTYCYTLFVDTGGGTFSGGRSNQGRPMDTSGPIKWAFSTGVFSIAAPTVGGAGVIAASNEPVLHAMERGLSGGEWPASWLPMPLMGPVQSRSPIVPISVGPANPVVYLASQDGHVHVVDGSQGGAVGYPWSPKPLGTLPTLPGQAAPAGMFTAFGGTFDYLLVGTRDAVLPNRVYAIDPIGGNVIDFFDNGGGGPIGIINGMGSVDYGNDRFYFASHDAGGGSLWSVDLLPYPPATMSLNWSRPLGNIDSSPVLVVDTVYVGSPLGTGTLYAVEAANGLPGNDRTFSHNDGQVKGFVFPDRASGDLYFATDNFVWALNDDGSTITNKFAGSITLAGGVVPTSAVLFVPGSHYVYVGGSDGRLYEIDVSGGAPIVKAWILGDGLSTVGAPSLDWPNNLLHVGTEAGVFYAVAIPFP